MLETEGIGIVFGGIRALADVNIKVNEWEIVGLIGPNGAGKTTLFNCITGFYKQTGGTIRFRGEDISNLKPHKRAARGIGRTFQQVGLVKSMTALENVMLAQHLEVGYSDVAGILGMPETFATENEIKRRAMRVLDFMGMADLANATLHGLPYGTLKLLEVSTVLATDPQILLLDEPAAGMGPEEAHAFGDRVKMMRDELGITVVMIDHHIPLVVAVSDYMYCLNFGTVLAEGSPEEVRNHPEVVLAYLGGDEAEKVVKARAKKKGAARGAARG